MDASGDGPSVAPYTIVHVPDNALEPTHLSHTSNNKKRTREVNAQGGEASGKSQKKRKRRSSDDTVLPVDDTISVAGPIKKKEKKKRKEKSSVLPSSSSYEDRDFTDHGLDFSSIIDNSAAAAAADSAVGDLHLQSSDHHDPDAPPLNSNEDILRAFQGLDFSRLAGVLRGLELPSADVDLNTDDNPFGELLGPSYPLDDQITITDTPRLPPGGTTDISVSSTSELPHKTKRFAVSSTAAQQRSKPSSKPTSPEINPGPAAVRSSVANITHAEMLATKWLSAAKLKELVETEALVYKKGKFSMMEQQALKTAVENYRVNCGLSHESMQKVIFSKTKEEHATFWSEITASVPGRPIIAVYHYIHRVYDPLRLQGKWTNEEDAALISAVGDLGLAWQKIKDQVGRSAQDCRDRWRNHLVNRSERQRGPWSKEEEEELTRIVQELTTEQGKNADTDIFWTAISQRMGNKRSRQQCRVKWTDSLNKAVKNGGEKPRWSKTDYYILVHKVAAMEVRDDSEIDWKLLSDDDWNLWSAHILQRQWRQLKQSIKGHGEITFQELTEILKQKCTLPSFEDPASPLKRKSVKSSFKSPKKPKSAPVIDDKWEDDRWESEEQP